MMGLIVDAIVDSVMAWGCGCLIHRSRRAGFYVRASAIRRGDRNHIGSGEASGGAGECATANWGRQERRRPVHDRMSHIVPGQCASLASRKDRELVRLAIWAAHGAHTEDISGRCDRRNKGRRRTSRPKPRLKLGDFAPQRTSAIPIFECTASTAVQIVPSLVGRIHAADDRTAVNENQTAHWAPQVGRREVRSGGERGGRPPSWAHDTDLETNTSPRLSVPDKTARPWLSRTTF